MKPLRNPLCVFLTTAFLSATAIAQKVEVDISVCYEIADVLTAMKNGSLKEDVSAMLDSVFLTRAYKTMFKHYNRPFRPNHLPESVFKRMILNLQFPGSYTAGENQRADQMSEIWTTFYRDLDLYQRNLQQLRYLDLTVLINEGVRYAQNWLPRGWSIPDFYFLILPNGGSDAFTIDGAQGYDFFQLPRDSSGNINGAELVGTIAHESHHLGMKGSFPASMTKSDSFAYQFLTLFVAEGAATKFVDNAPGGHVPVVNGAREHEFTEPVGHLWRTYTADAAGIFDRMVTTFEKAYSGAFTNADINAEIRGYWLTGLKGRAYFVGSELLGAIYHAFGKEQLFATMKDPRQMFDLYTKAIQNKPEQLGQCIAIPDSTVQHALAIGLPKR